MSRPIITLTTDFGQADAYVGAMKGVMLGICPEAALVDVSHQIRPQAVRQAAYMLSTTTPYFPAGTVHLVVVDPGVGSARRAIAVEGERGTYIAPDNGVLTMALDLDPPRRAAQFTEPHFRLPEASATFHGRDIFAPAAAHLAAGARLDEMGEPIPPTGLVSLPSVEPQQQPDGSWRGEILHVDRFGNLITNVQQPRPKAELAVEAGGQRIEGLRRTFADVAVGDPVLYVGSSGHLEIAVREGNAADELGVDIGAPLRIEGLA